MDPILRDTEELLNNLFDNRERVILREIEEEIINNPVFYDIEKLWILDKNIGGIGAYSMPANSIKNPLPGGIGRTIYRPLQYARENIEINNINNHARYAIQNVGLHLEGLVKYIIKKESIIGIQSRKLTLGQGIKKLNRQNFDNTVFVNLGHVREIYNLSKHAINDDEKRKKTFTPMDAIVFYLASRKIGNSLLINHKSDLYMEMSEYLYRLEIY